MPETIPGYAVTKRGPNGEPRRIQCMAHRACDWFMDSPGARTDADPIFAAQWQNHMRESATPTVQAFGHLRKART